MDQTGNFEQVVVEDPQQIADKVLFDSYNAMIAADMNLGIREIPTIQAENIKETLLTRIWIKNYDVKLSKRILNSLVNFIKDEIDEKIEIEINDIESTIRAEEIENERRIKEIEILKKKLKIIGQRKNDIIEEMKSVKNKIEEIEKEQIKVLQKENRSEIESLGMLLYSNEIQQSLRYYDILNEKLSIERIREEDVNSNMQIENETINKIDNTIANLKERKGTIDYTEIVKKPTSFVNPISPRKKLNILIAFIFGFFMFTLLAFFLEYAVK